MSKKLVCQNPKAKCAKGDKDSFELHELYKKHEYRPISEDNAIQYCPSCGSWVVDMNREAFTKTEDGKLSKLQSTDFRPYGGLDLQRVMSILSKEQQASLAAHLKADGWGNTNKERAKELEKYL